jgi:hypothetical protein
MIAAKAVVDHGRYVFQLKFTLESNSELIPAILGTHGS